MNDSLEDDQGPLDHPNPPNHSDPSNNVPHSSFVADCSIPAFLELIHIPSMIIESAQNLKLFYNSDSGDSVDTEFNDILNNFSSGCSTSKSCQFQFFSFCQ